MFELFKTRAEASGNTEVKRFETTLEALDFINDFLKEENIQDVAGSYAVWADGPLLKQIDTKVMEKKFPGLSFNVTRELAKGARVGISQLKWGIAELGSMAQDSADVEQRLASALSWIHVAILPTTKIVANLADFMKKMHPKEYKYMTLITGASKTADIERVLALGVHGPDRLVILCVDDLEVEGA
ncbi:LutC/YkgG family protein [Sulfurospirillum arcachonense]|uniref:LutC/YkgG family protein n=1 Tax=Sulfurospirillum arcachonense TaxID=57666 RepID=UPI000468FCAB|nr:lactate utilization protein [Sulfurospirillum arcachonense]